MKRYHFVGVGGSGMSALALVIRARGNQVSGSDRSYDQGLNQEFFQFLKNQGIQLFPQDGSGIQPDLNWVVVSSAIEKDNLDITVAAQFKIPIIHRAELLAKIFNPSLGIAIGGTSGKSTVTGMISVILEEAGLNPTVINGGIILQRKGKQWLGNSRVGREDLMVIETDESDGSISYFSPQVGVITNISKDHKEISELLTIFSGFAQSIKGCLVLNGDCPHTGKIRPPGKKIITYGLREGVQLRAKNLCIKPDSSKFQVEGTTFYLRVPGRHNISNALAAIAVADYFEIDRRHTQKGLENFMGIKRRLECLGRFGGITVFDDFSHNPAKITSALETLRMSGKRLIVIYQPHGYAPTKFLLQELAEVFNQYLFPSDYLILLDIFDAGGSAPRDISSLDLLQKVSSPESHYYSDRDKVIAKVKEIAHPGDVIVIMGARDDTLSALARRLALAFQ